ncbi:class F sortase [Ornithinimicrobium pratense]|uniref:Class F sortase n=2 Tax=Ornithinimicrobium pratense TaxID=2593973 RepID=A0A5J6VAM8_9MICO|nr:class F sortase [Ornithinimicrobium pratense]QFG70353.1 class F sortase [Ornithinimicrobium pratense]
MVAYYVTEAPAVSSTRALAASPGEVSPLTIPDAPAPAPRLNPDAPGQPGAPDQSHPSDRATSGPPSLPTHEVTDGEISRPTNLTVDGIEVDSVLRPLGLNADGSLEVPPPGPRYDDAGWFTGSPRPGEVGPAILLGHVNGVGGKPSVFFRLAELRPGDRVTVGREDGSQARFEVYRVEQHPKDAFPTAAVYGDTTGSELRLITCAGEWDHSTGHYRDNTVVYATRILEP